MQFSNTSTPYDGLIQDCESLVFGSDNYGAISGNTTRLADFTNKINRAYDKLATKIMSVDGRWQWDDSNYSDHPIGSTQLNSGQQDYAFDVEHMEISKVLIRDSAGNKTLITPIDENDPIGRSLLEDSTSTGGTPMFYDKKGASMFLYPTPNYTKAAGLIVHYQRKPSYFATSDTTKAPGVPALFHRYLSLEASIDYTVSKQQPVKNDWIVLLKEIENDMMEFYSKRSKDEQKILKSVKRSSR